MYNHTMYYMFLIYIISLCNWRTILNKDIFIIINIIVTIITIIIIIISISIIIKYNKVSGRL